MELRANHLRRPLLVTASVVGLAAATTLVASCEGFGDADSSNHAIDTPVVTHRPHHPSTTPSSPGTEVAPPTTEHHHHADKKSSHTTSPTTHDNDSNPKSESGLVATFDNPTRTHTATEIVIGGKHKSANMISPYLLGANNVWYDNGYGTANPETEQPYSQLVNDAKAMGLTLLRYPGGNPSDYFHFLTAIGPQSSRSPSIVDGGSYTRPTATVPSRYGPDEYYRLLQETGAAGDITVNFGTGSAQEAADWVCYSEGTANDKTDPACDKWALLRMHNGIYQPANIKYWEVGNEPYVSMHWASGEYIKGRCMDGDPVCEYLYGGETQFTNQQVMMLNSQSYPNGSELGRGYYLADGPAVPGSVKLTVSLPNGEALPKGMSLDDFSEGRLWTEVPKAQLSRYTINNRVYALDATTGQITFPETAAESKQLPDAAVVDASYKVKNAGFIGYYRAMKKADPNANICSSYPVPEVWSTLARLHINACEVIHDYGVTNGSDYNNYSLDQFHNQVMLDTENFAEQLSQTREQLEAIYGNPVGKHIAIVLSEYGILNYDYPDINAGSVVAQRDYHRSMDLAVYEAEMLRNFALAGVSAAERHYLVGYALSHVPGLKNASTSRFFSNNAMIDSTYPKCTSVGCSQPEFVEQPSALVYYLFKHLLDNQVVTTSVKHDPLVTVVPSRQGTNNYPGALSGSYESLSPLAVRSGNKTELLVINDSTSAQTTSVKEQGESIAGASAETIAGKTMLSHNSIKNPNNVRIVSAESGALKDKKLLITLPPDSVSLLQLSA